MESKEYENLRKAVEDTFTSLYVVDVGSLTPDQRQKHQESLGLAHLAVIRLENKKFSELTEHAKKKLASLSAGALELQKQLAGLKKASETLEIVAGALDIFTSILKLLK